MNCRRAERLRSLSKDHPLPVRTQAALKTHLAHCPACQEREVCYRRLVAQLHTQEESGLQRDLLANALLQANTKTFHAATSPSPQAQMQTRLGWKRALLRGVMVAVIALLIVGTTLMEMRPRRALGQNVLQKIREAVGKTKTTHIVSWQFLPNEEEARNHTWHDGKKPFRFETWLTRSAMSGTDEINGPYLWTIKGYLHYDRSAGRVEYMSMGAEATLAEALKDAANPLTEIQRAIPAGTYLSAKRLGEARWKGKTVYKLEITSGPKRPESGESSPVQQPGKTAPLGQAPFIRQTFWVDKTTDLPVYSEFEKQIQQRWVITARSEYDYNRPAPMSLFDPEAVRKAAEAFFAARKPH